MRVLLGVMIKTSIPSESISRHSSVCVLGLSGRLSRSSMSAPRALARSSMNAMSFCQRAAPPEPMETPIFTLRLLSSQPPKPKSRIAAHMQDSHFFSISDLL